MRGQVLFFIIRKDYGAIVKFPSRIFIMKKIIKASIYSLSVTIVSILLSAIVFIAFVPLRAEIFEPWGFFWLFFVIPIMIILSILSGLFYSKYKRGSLFQLFVFFSVNVIAVFILGVIIGFAINIIWGSLEDIFSEI